MSETRRNMEFQLASLEAELAGKQAQVDSLKRLLNETLICPECQGSSQKARPADQEGRTILEDCLRCKSAARDQWGGSTIGRIYKLE